ncbi:hypothetical protein VSH64_13075 [Amycolatopsis rhabdoformis]|uniref:ABM domain-containing protein n=1 Tax=Amycolatopsis rhabdoformis TaxID=1448059 RepID=A0ABZ1IG31_9PSEU|nr:hypothetical protein [Amycolatopsis rhabdoformis]WSE33036.1 hypothetical protein VSH64_13075 [Amycolatopsis rhabdoformis]
MFARSTTIQLKPASLDDAVAHVRDTVMPAALGTEGNVGLSMLVGRGDSRTIVTTAWRSAEAMQESAQAMDVLGRQVAEMFGGPPQVEEWEIALLHRDHHAGAGAAVRGTWLKVDPDHVDAVVDVFKMTTLPRLAEFAGFCSASLLVDRESGRCVASIGYDSAAALERTSEQANSLRAATLKEAGAERLDVREFDLVIAHLNVPEMA